MTITRQPMSTTRKRRYLNDVLMFYNTMDNQPEQEEARYLISDARRLLNLCTRIRNDLHSGGNLPDNWRDREHELAMTYCQIRSYQNALIRMLGKQMITSYPQWVYRWMK